MASPLLRAQVFSETQELAHGLATNQLVKVGPPVPPSPPPGSAYRLTVSCYALVMECCMLTLRQAVDKKNKAAEHALLVIRNLVAQWSAKAGVEDEASARACAASACVTSVIL